ncbi:MAG: insulinase family protein [Phycisphaerales bacterium]|nr:insulinase family protein [Phycisphaerales bacterium]
MTDAPCHSVTRVEQRPLTCGATLIVETNPSVRSTSLAWYLPTGTMHDEPMSSSDDAGACAILCGAMLERGAGGRDSRTLNDELDRIGVIRDISVRASLTRITASVRADQLNNALALLSDLVCRPLLPQSSLEPIRSLCLQAIDGLSDDPSTLASLSLTRRAVPAPLNRSSYGSAERLQTATHEEIVAAWRERFRPEGSIIAIAGAVDADNVEIELNRLLDDWEGATPPMPMLVDPLGGRAHLEQETAQVHLEMGLEGPRVNSDEELPFHAAIRALGGGTSSRLFTNVRERKGLCYDVHAGFAATKHFGLCSIGAGTTPDRAEQTVTCIQEELERMGAEGLQPEEFERIRCGLKTHLMMHGESTAARASGLAMDLHNRGYVRTLADLANLIEQLSFGEVDDVARAYMTPAWIADAVCVSVGPATPFKA